MSNLLSFKAKSLPYSIIRASAQTTIPYPYFRQNDGDVDIFCPSPLHGRSFVVARNAEGRFVVSKGNGLSYSDQTLIYTGENHNDTWGLLLERDAIRDFEIGLEIESLGIKSNQMEYVLKLDAALINPVNGFAVNPVLLQYNVESPYRICDFAFMSSEEVEFETQKWEKLNEKAYPHKYQIAAEVMIKNLRMMHDLNILHNAIHIQNYTWALELLDFELARTNTYPYANENHEMQYPILFHREMIQTYEIINYIAWCLKEPINYAQVDALFAEYGFDLAKYGFRK